MPSAGSFRNYVSSHYQAAAVVLTQLNVYQNTLEHQAKRRSSIENVYMLIAYLLFICFVSVRRQCFCIH